MLGGCVAGIAASAAGLAARELQGTPTANAHLHPDAVAACSARAAAYGTVKLIDVEQRSAGKIVVWGTAGDDAARQSFECAFGTRVTAFKLRPITPRSR